MYTPLPTPLHPSPPPLHLRQEQQPQSNTWPTWTPGEQAAVLIVSVFIGLLILGLAVWLVKVRRRKAREARGYGAESGKSGQRRGRGARGERVSSESRIGLTERSQKRNGEGKRVCDRQEREGGAGARLSGRTRDAGGGTTPVREQAPSRGILDGLPPTTPTRTRNPRPVAPAPRAPSRLIQPPAAEDALMSGALSNPGSPMIGQLTGRREGNDAGAGARRRSGSGSWRETEQRRARANGSKVKLGKFFGEDVAGVSKAMKAVQDSREEREERAHRPTGR